MGKGRIAFICTRRDTLVLPATAPKVRQGCLENTSSELRLTYLLMQPQHVWHAAGACLMMRFGRQIISGASDDTCRTGVTVGSPAVNDAG